MRKLRTLSLIVAFAVIAQFANAQTVWKTTNASVTFKIKNAGINVKGSFGGFKGKILFNPNNLAGSKFIGIVQAGTVNTKNRGRDRHLRKSDFFDVAKYPTIKMKSTKITKSGGKFYADFQLTIKGKTKTYKVPFNFSQKGKQGTFKAYFEINRKDFGVGGNSLILSKTAKITLNVTASAS